MMAATFWLYRLAKVLCSLLGYWEIRAFYTKALKIPSVSEPSSCPLGNSSHQEYICSWRIWKSSMMELGLP